MAKTGTRKRTTAAYVPSKKLLNVWECTCGNINHTGQGCLKCGKNFADARQEALNRLGIKSNPDAVTNINVVYIALSSLDYEEHYTPSDT